MEWNALCKSNEARYLVKGTELAQAILPGYLGRWALIEVRCVEDDGELGTCYRLRDAETVTDAELREGVRPRIVAEGSYRYLIRWATRQRHWCYGDPRSTI